MFKTLFGAFFALTVIFTPFYSTGSPEPAEEYVSEAQNAPVSDVGTKDDVRYYVASKRAIHGHSEALVMKIIECESGFNQDATNYKAVIGVDRGLFQINDHYHPDLVDYYDPQENLDYGFSLLASEGTAPWKWSEHCWGVAL